MFCLDFLFWYILFNLAFLIIGFQISFTYFFVFPTLFFKRLVGVVIIGARLNAESPRGSQRSDFIGKLTQLILR